MLGQQLRQDLVLGLHLLLQKLDPLLLFIGLTRRAFTGFEGHGSVLEEFLLPAVENRGPYPFFFTKLGNRYFVQKVASEDGNFLLGGVMLALVFHTLSRLS